MSNCSIQNIKMEIIKFLNSYNQTTNNEYNEFVRNTISNIENIPNESNLNSFKDLLIDSFDFDALPPDDETDNEINKMIDLIVGSQPSSVLYYCNDMLNAENINPENINPENINPENINPQLNGGKYKKSTKRTKSKRTKRTKSKRTRRTRRN